MPSQQTSTSSDAGPSRSASASSSSSSASSSSSSSRHDAKGKGRAPDSAPDDDDEAIASAADGGEEEEEEEQPESAMSNAFLVSYFVAGGAAGATSRTVVSPLERLKIIMQVQPHEPSASKSGAASGAPGAGVKPKKGAYNGVWSGLVKMWREEGFKGFMRGNGINCLRIAPYSAVQFSTYEILKNAMKDPDGQLDVPRRLTAGALAGIASVVSTYPLDLVRSRISIASASLYSDAQKSVAATTAAAHEDAVKRGANAEKRAPTRAEMRRIIEARQKDVPGIAEMTMKVYREEGGMRGLYRGCVATSMGVAPYVGLNFACYEALVAHARDEDGDLSTFGKLVCGAIAGSISQTLTYPLDVLRRRMQVAGMKDSKLGYSDKTSFGVIRTLVQREGIAGLYRGLGANLAKVAPSIGVSFATYEICQSFIHDAAAHAQHH